MRAWVDMRAQTRPEQGRLRSNALLGLERRDIKALARLMLSAVDSNTGDDVSTWW
jgi:hypothetical protein